MRALAFIAAAFAVLTSSLANSPAWSQAPRAVKVIVPYPPGGGADVAARVLANQIGNLHGPTMVVETRPGAGTAIGTADVVRSVPDGNTLLFTNNALLLTPHLRKLDYDPLTGLVPICMIGTTPMVVIVNSSSPYRTLDDLIKAARARPGALTYAAGVGAMTQLGYAMLERRADIHMTLVPYTGTLPEVEAVFTGQVDSAFVDYPPAAGLVKSGKLRVLATGSAKPVEWLPDVPTVGESGYKDYAIELWYGAFAPAGTPQQAIADYIDWFTKAVHVPETRARLMAGGIEPGTSCGAPFASYLRRSFDEYGATVRDAGIKVE